MKDYLADKSVSTQEEDKFQRYEFARRIAHTIVDRKGKESIVFGIYGEWGEGKSSIINFIHSEISKEPTEQFVLIKFNPWRFNSEDALLKTFFNSIATKLQPKDRLKRSKGVLRRFKNQARNNPLNTSSESLGQLFQSYGQLASVVGLGDAVQSIGETLATVDIESLKNRISKKLEDSKRRIIIFIDDIDRLEKSEIHSIFRLVKLTGDFPYITYLLSFDAKMVAAAIGDRFGQGNFEAGESFLEKIVQVPLRLPKIQPAILNEFCVKNINETMKSIDIELEQNEAARFAQQFSDNILIRLKTPRLAVRYSNLLSFSLPLLSGEVNLVDLMLIEAIKIFYPKHYDFIKQNSIYFLHTYRDGKKDAKAKELVTYLDYLNEDLTKSEQEKIKDLICHLFPKIKDLFWEISGFGSNYEELFTNKRIASIHYFERYFTYCVLNGEISDSHLDLFIDKIKSKDSIVNIQNALTLMVRNARPDFFIYKLKLYDVQFDWDETKTLVQMIGILNIKSLTDEPIWNADFHSARGQSILFIADLLAKHKSEKDFAEYLKGFFEETLEFTFAYELYDRLIHYDDKTLINDNVNNDLLHLLLAKGKRESRESSIFHEFPEHKKYIIEYWVSTNRDDFNEYVTSYLNETKENVNRLILSYLPKVYTIGSQGYYNGDLNKERYSYMVSQINKDDLFEHVNQVIPIDELREDMVIWEDENVNRKTAWALRQFVHWYDLESA